MPCQNGQYALSSRIHEIEVAGVFIQNLRDNWILPKLMNVFRNFWGKIEVLVGFIKLEV